MVENLIQIKSGIMINVDASAKKYHICEKDYIWNPAICSYENGKYLTSIINNSVITCAKIIDAEETNSIPKNIICETKSFYILRVFLSITMALLVAFSIYFCLIKYKAKQNISCHITLQMTN